jgi:hypothetical protein
MKQRFKLALTGKLFFDRNLAIRLNRPLDSNRVKISVFTKRPQARLTFEATQISHRTLGFGSGGGPAFRDGVRIKLEDFPFACLFSWWNGQAGLSRETKSASGFGLTTVLWNSTTALAWPFANCVKHYETTPMHPALSRRFPGAAIDLSPPSPSRTPTTWLVP